MLNLIEVDHGKAVRNQGNDLLKGLRGYNLSFYLFKYFCLRGVSLVDCH